MFISVDPGLRVGVAAFHNDGSDFNRRTMTQDEFKMYLQSLYELTKATGNSGMKVHFLYEKFTLRQDMAIAQTGSDMPASRAIGMLEQIAFMLGDQATLETCESRNLKTALKWAGFPELANKPRTWHCPDDISAYSHGVMWLINKGIRKHPIFES